MSKDIFRNVFGITDQQAGRLIRFGDKKDIKNLRDYLKISVPLQIAKELFLNVGREKIKEKEDLNDRMGLLTEQVLADYNAPEAKRIREELIKFNDPTQRDDFIYKKSLEGINRYVNEASGGKILAYSPEINKVNPKLALEINNYRQQREKEIIDLYNQKNINPIYTIQTQEEFIKPYINLTLAEKKYIEDNPANRNLFTQAINKIFPNTYAKELLELKEAIDKENNIIKKRTNLVDEYKKLTTGDFKKYIIPKNNVAPVNTSVLQPYSFDNKDIKSIQDNSEELFKRIENGVYQNERIGENNYELSSRNFNKLEYLNGESGNQGLSANRYFVRQVAKYSKVFEKYDAQAREQGIFPFGRDVLSYEDIALEFLIDNGLIDKDTNTVNFLDSQETSLFDEKARFRTEGNPAQQGIALMDEAARKNAKSFDNSILSDLKIDFNEMRRDRVNIVAEGDADKLINIDEDLKAAKNFISYLENKGDDNEDFNKELDRQRVRFLLTIDSDDDSYYRIPQGKEEVTLRGNQIPFELKEEYYNKYILKHGEDIELTQIFETLKPAEDKEVVTTEDDEDKLSKSEAEQILDGDIPYAIFGEQVEIPELNLLTDEELKSLKSYELNLYNAQLNKINQMKAELIAGVRDVSDLGGPSKKQQVMNRMQFDGQIRRIIGFSNRFNDFDFIKRVGKQKIRNIESQLKKEKLKLERYNLFTPLNEIDEEVVKNSEIEIKRLQNELSLLVDET